MPNSPHEREPEVSSKHQSVVEDGHGAFARAAQDAYTEKFFRNEPAAFDFAAKKNPSK